MASRSLGTVNRRTAVRSRDTDKRRRPDTANLVTAISQWHRPTATRAGASASARGRSTSSCRAVIALVCLQDLHRPRRDRVSGRGRVDLLQHLPRRQDRLAMGPEDRRDPDAQGSNRSATGRWAARSAARSCTSLTASRATSATSGRSGTPRSRRSPTRSWAPWSSTPSSTSARRKARTVRRPGLPSVPDHHHPPSARDRQLRISCGRHCARFARFQQPHGMRSCARRLRSFGVPPPAAQVHCALRGVGRRGGRRRTTKGPDGEPSGPFRLLPR